jgi:DNA-binding transcriptional LysR family regulator
MKTPHSGRLPFDLRSLEIFLGVCETGGMAAAARRLGMTQPAVSQAIADIEARSGVPLFDRKVRPLGLTPAGVVLRQRASTLLADALQIPPMLRETRKGRFPLVRVGLVDSLSRTLGTDLAAFLSTRADQVSLLSGLTMLHASAFFTRRLDIFVGVDELIEIEGLERWPILDEPYIVLWPKKLGDLTERVDLGRLASRAPFIRFSARSKTGAEIDQHLRRLRLDVPRRQEFDTPYGVTATVAAGLGWAITTPLCLLEAAVPLDDIRIAPLPGPTLRRSLTLVARGFELGSLPRQIADLACDILRDKCLPFVERQCPWAGDQFIIGSRRNPKEVRRGSAGR